MIQDPHETENLLFTHPEDFESIRLNLRRQLIEKEKQWGLKGCIVDDDFVRYEDFELTDYNPHPHIAGQVAV